MGHSASKKTRGLGRQLGKSIIQRDIAGVKQLVKDSARKSMFIICGELVGLAEERTRSLHVADAVANQARWHLLLLRF